DIDALRRQLSDRLPPTLIPSRYHQHEQLPLTATGKIDRKALQRQLNPAQTDYQPPQGETEQQLARIWCEVLGVERISREADFFAVGGHSLKALLVISRVRKAFEVELALKTFFETPSVAGLAGYIDRAQTDGEKTSSLPLERIERNQPLPMSFEQQRLWYIHQYEQG